MKNRALLISVAILGFLIVFSYAPAGGAQVAAQDVYKAKCASCHAADGTGNTPAGKALKVRDFRAPEVQKLTDDQLIEITAKGKNKMPGYEKTLKAEQIKSLVAYVRELTKKK